MRRSVRDACFGPGARICRLHTVTWLAEWTGLSRARPGRPPIRHLSRDPRRSRSARGRSFLMPTCFERRATRGLLILGLDPLRHLPERLGICPAGPDRTGVDPYVIRLTQPRAARRDGVAGVQAGGDHAPADDRSDGPMDPPGPCRVTGALDRGSTCRAPAGGSRRPRPRSSASSARADRRPLLRARPAITESISSSGDEVSLPPPLDRRSARRSDADPPPGVASFVRPRPVVTAARDGPPRPATTRLRHSAYAPACRWH